MDTVAARLQMVDQQIRTWEVLDPRVLDVLVRVPREAFVPSAYRELAFADAPIAKRVGQRMQQRFVRDAIIAPTRSAEALDELHDFAAVF